MLILGIERGDRYDHRFNPLFTLDAMPNLGRDPDCAAGRDRMFIIVHFDDPLTLENVVDFREGFMVMSGCIIDGCHMQ